jgi:1-acyl-sn-glycerol-3-phosphate acyltransferase
LLRPTPLPLRLARSARLVAHLAEGLLTTALVFPWLGTPRKRALIRHWSRRLLAILRVEARIHGLPEGGFGGNVLIVANHISWLDIFVLNALEPARFVAKAELRRWPLVGRLIVGVGTLFIERERRHDTHNVNRRAAVALARGDVVAVLPEGTTTDGTVVLPFHGSLLQPIVDAEGHVLPIAIRYRGLGGDHNDAPAYVGETTFLESFWRITGERRLVVELHCVPALAARARHRRELARAAEHAIRSALGSPPSARAPDKRVDRQA